MTEVNQFAVAEKIWQDVVAFGNCVIVDKATTFSQCYAASDALVVGFAFVIVLAAYSFIWSIIGQNCSKVDQIWSITPVLFVWHFYKHYSTTHNGAVHQRLLLIGCLVTLWGVRLTFNFWRKGGYGNLITHEEDYRWPIIRKKVHPILFFFFNLTFIAIYQNLLLFLIAAPAYEVMIGDSEINQFDIAVAVLFVVLWLVETIADEQHFQFQTYKHKLSVTDREKHKNKDIRDGFYTSGLFRFSRHPNYFAEQSLWVAVYLFSVTHVCCHMELINWSLSGCLQLILLFQGSMNFGESISLSKYPKYAQYQETTPQCIPNLLKIFEKKREEQREGEASAAQEKEGKKQK